MPSPRRRLAALVATLAVAAVAPAPAGAQSAGDDQYQDPFAGQGGGEPAPSATPAPEGEAPPAAAPPAEAPAPVTAAPAAPAAVSTQAPLPYTGSETVLVALAGAALLLAGLALRALTGLDGVRRR
jgi:LPXTG-motif cell wall-anchored protein